MKVFDGKFTYIEIATKAAIDVIELLENNILGTPDKSMRYQHLGVKKKIAQLSHPHFASIRKTGQLVGTCCFCERETGNIGVAFKAFYIRFFSFKAQYRKKSISNKTQNKSSGLLKQEAQKLLEGNGLTDNLNNKAFFYAYVDPKNKRSAKLCEEFGFMNLREFSTVSFSRFYPKPNKQVSRITPAEKAKVYELVKNHYKNYSMVSFENLFYNDNYYLLKGEDGEILAGVQANPENWRIIEMPGISGRLILNTIPHIPILKKLFNKNYKFVSFESIIYKQGFEHKLQPLFETILVNFKVNSALIWVDNQTELYKHLKALDLGLQHKIKKEVKANVIGKFLNTDINDINKIKNSPAFISSFDLT